MEHPSDSIRHASKRPRRPVRLAAARGVAGALLLLVVGWPSPSRGCSICRCGDATFNALGRAGYIATGLRVAIDWERFDKNEGDPAEGEESQVEDRTTALLSYGFSDRFTLVARVPFSRRELTESEGDGAAGLIRTSGVSDPEIYGQMRLWASPLSEFGRRATLTGTAGIKTPWGENALRREGARADEHAQPGTGSSDLFGGLAFLYLLDAHSALFASASYRAMGENDHGYRYGDVASASLAYEHKLGERFDGVVSLDARDAGMDRPGGGEARNPDTGGRLLYLAPRLLVDVGHGFVLRAGAQIPIARDLNGHQTERAVLNVGMTHVFLR